MNNKKIKHSKENFLTDSHKITFKKCDLKLSVTRRIHHSHPRIFDLRWILRVSLIIHKLNNTVANRKSNFQILLNLLKMRKTIFTIISNFQTKTCKKLVRPFLRNALDPNVGKTSLRPYSVVSKINIYIHKIVFLLWVNYYKSLIWAVTKTYTRKF